MIFRDLLQGFIGIIGVYSDSTGINQVLVCNHAESYEFSIIDLEINLLEPPKMNNIVILDMFGNKIIFKIHDMCFLRVACWLLLG